MKKKGLLLGFGTMGVTHWQCYEQLGVRILGVVDPNEEARQRAKERGLTVFDSLHAAWQKEHCDFIDICTPTYLHAAQIEEASAYQIPLLVEKPVVRIAEEAHALLARKNLPAIMVGEVEQYNPHLAEFITVASRPTRLSMERLVNLDFFLHGTEPWFLDEEKSGGIVLDLMIHDLTLLIAKYGVPVIEHVRGSSSGKYGTVDDVTATLRYPDFSATLHTSWLSTDQQPIRLTITMQDKDGKRVSWDGGTYGLGGTAQERADPFLRELTAFLSMINTRIPPYPLDLYCRAVLLASGITERLHRKPRAN